MGGRAGQEARGAGAEVCVARQESSVAAGQVVHEYAAARAQNRTGE